MKLASLASIEVKGFTPAIVFVFNCKFYVTRYILLKWMRL